jgi:DNA-binding response OmpR family regulator
MTRVLLVEDDKTMLSLLTTLLGIEGYDVLQLEDDSEAGIIRSICTQLPDLVMMDVNLIRANGLDVLRQVRQQSDCKDVRILMSSGMDLRLECRDAGADGFLQKPYMPDDLIRHLKEVMEIDDP